MWSFTDCLVMVGGWDTAMGQMAGGQAAGTCLSLAQRTAGRKSSGNHTEKQASKQGGQGPIQSPGKGCVTDTQ